MKSKLAITLFCVGSVFFTVGSAAETNNNLIVVGSQSKSSAHMFSMDFQSDGTATALEIRMQIGADEKAKVDTSACAKSLPKSHAGSCVFNGKELVVLVYSEKNALLPAGLLDLGTVRVSGGAISKALKVNSIIAGSPAGVAVPSSSSVEAN